MNVTAQSRHVTVPSSLGTARDSLMQAGHLISTELGSGPAAREPGLGTNTSVSPVKTVAEKSDLGR
ncbi:MAG: hypothetical protein BGO01_09160 [Armatimonadetes bacterium 55-13]|nr:MAG: hypothetical protein BGO01_09160 [Armatimonadetes bacterium 55-13]